MKGFFLRTWLWIKATLLAAVLLYLALFVFNNNRRVEVWIWFGPKTDVSLLGLISTLLATGVVLTLLIKTVFTTIRQLQQARAKARTARLEREVAEMRAKADMLQKREAASSFSPTPAPTTSPAAEASSDI